MFFGIWFFFGRSSLSWNIWKTPWDSEVGRAWRWNAWQKLHLGRLDAIHEQNWLKATKRSFRNRIGNGHDMYVYIYIYRYTYVHACMHACMYVQEWHVKNSESNWVDYRNWEKMDKFLGIFMREYTSITMVNNGHKTNHSWRYHGILSSYN